MKALQTGDRVAYAAAFLRITGQHTGQAPQRRGTIIGSALPGWGPSYCRVQWDDTLVRIAARQGDYSEPDYCETIARDGQHLPTANLAKIGSSRFATNNL